VAIVVRRLMTDRRVTLPLTPDHLRIVGTRACPEFVIGVAQSTEDVDGQFAIE
jgi:hypothetical protein